MFINATDITKYKKHFINCITPIYNIFLMLLTMCILITSLYKLFYNILSR